MSEQNVINKKKILVTKKKLKEDFHSLGLEPGMTIIVHSSLSAIGWVCGQEIAVVQALMEVISPKGTIIMPAQTTNNSDPATWEDPPVPEEWWETIRQAMPAFDPNITPTYGMGRIAEAFRKFPGTKRSNHPAVSFSAWGKHASFITNNHALHYPFGDQSPLARIYELNGYILLLGVDYSRNTSMHLAEFLSKSKKEVTQHCALLQDGKRTWGEFKTLEDHADIFNKIGKTYEKTYTVQNGLIGAAPSKLIKQRSLIDFTTQYLDERI
ncbi:aminoglycoside N(3)-acetyltransferase [Heyndrickxia ginsengihumi]|uniref:aminoglycoside N(3)-acetyltransferase n=1 Tax=Heyndrickxia ginsengihumi TaxID=363870 RepID=UPI00203DB419|nr:AAC(3) family N-acetyltransferase [Heyndrickxia ginsengihumi]MCM3023893.1 AAC(3) family N-acetyltransferase [Heyndrickxia ginsengihumi]